MKVERISDACVSSIDTDNREVLLQDDEAVYRYIDDSIVLLLHEAMTRKATFIIKDWAICGVELEEGVRARAG